jgi:hypothetical protein
LAGLAAAIVGVGLYVFGTQHVPDSPRWRLPSWTLPLLGGTLVTTVVVLWCTSALWYFNDFTLP